MKKNVVLDVSNYFSERLDYDKNSYEKFRYELSILYLNFTKTLVLILIALALGILKEAMIFMGAYALVRTFGFETHAQSSIKCTIIGVAFFLGGTYAGIYIRFNAIAYILLLLLSLIMAMLYAPLFTECCPLAQPEFA